MLLFMISQTDCSPFSLVVVSHMTSMCPLEDLLLLSVYVEVELGVGCWVFFFVAEVCLL